MPAPSEDSSAQQNPIHVEEKKKNKILPLKTFNLFISLKAAP